MATEAIVCFGGKMPQQEYIDLDDDERERRVTELRDEIAENVKGLTLLLQGNETMILRYTGTEDSIQKLNDFVRGTGKANVNPDAKAFRV